MLKNVKGKSKMPNECQNTIKEWRQYELWSSFDIVVKPLTLSYTPHILKGLSHIRNLRMSKKIKGCQKCQENKKNIWQRF